MKGNRALDELLISYLSKELNSEDEAFVIEYINSGNDARKHFEELQNTWKLLSIKRDLESVDVNDEWTHFELAITKEKQSLVPVKKPERFEEALSDHNRVHNNPGIRKAIIAVAVAASLITLVTLSWKFSSGNDEPAKKVSRLETSSPISLPLVKHEINNSGRKRRLHLQDGSEIILDNKSEVSYREPFSNSGRDIMLKGRAEFKVAKDKSRPFTVYSMDISTTALGTRFTVSAFEKAEDITVRLYEGKVVIKSIAGIKNKLDSDYYLLPGQTLTYNHKNYTATISKFNTQHSVPKNDNVDMIAGDDLNLPDHSKGSWNMFNNQPADQVFDQLKVLYNTEIIYSKKEVQSIYIIGRFDKSDSLITILNKIGKLNGLKVREEDGRFVISR